jgi:hypothetical protein
MNQTRYLKGECSECRGHIEFPAEATGTTIECPHCGKPTDLLLAAPSAQPSLPRKKIILTVATITLLVLGLGAALVALNKAQDWMARQKPVPPPPVSPATNAQPTADDPATKAGFKVTPINLEKTKGSSLVYAVGTIANPAARQRFGVKVQIDLLDGSGEKLGVATDYQQVLEPKGKWQFKALVVDSKAVSAKLASIKEDQ